MYKLRDRRELAKKIANCLQDKVYGNVDVLEDYMFDKFILYIKDRDIHYECDVSDLLYKVENEIDADRCIEEIFQDYKRMILGKYIV